MRAANIMRPSGLRTDMKKRGLWQKYSTRKNKRYKPHDGEYFTLAPRRDIHAQVALRAYAQSCATSWPELAKDIIRWLDSLPAP